jgi:two-component system nitrogen regulation response regulator GlnG
MVSKNPLVKNLVVVDDRFDDYAALRNRVAQHGLTMEVIGTGQEALRREAINAPNLWVVNMRLPDISGMDLTEMLRSRYPGVPVCLISDVYCSEEEIAARCTGAELYTCKPLEPEFLAAATS